MMDDLYYGCYVIIIIVGLVFWNCCIEKGGDVCCIIVCSSAFVAQIKKQTKTYFLYFCSLVCMIKIEIHKYNKLSKTITNVMLGVFQIYYNVCVGTHIGVYYIVFILMHSLVCIFNLPHYVCTRRVHQQLTNYSTILYKYR